MPRGRDEARKGEGQDLHQAEQVEGQAGLPVFECSVRQTARRRPAFRAAARVGLNFTFAISD